MSSSIEVMRRALWRNPVMLKEIRTRMRGGRAFAVVSVHLFVLSATLAFAFLVFNSSLNASSNLSERRTFGKAIFGLMVWMELIMVSFTAPALTSGAIASERERQTLDLLRVTLLSPSRLVAGKYFSGLVFIFLLLFSALPLLSLAFIIGGVLPEEIMIAVIILAVTAIAFCAVGIFFSSFFSRVLFATVLSYAFAIFLVFGIPMIFLFMLILFSSALGPTLAAMSLTSQLVLVFLGWLVVSITPGATMVATETALLNNQGIWLARLPLNNGAEAVLPSPWIAYIVLYLSISLILLIISVRRVRRVEV